MPSTPTVRARKVFATNVRRRRVALGLTQETLGERAGVHRTFIGAIERAENNVSIDTMERLAIALGLPLSALLEDEPT